MTAKKVLKHCIFNRRNHQVILFIVMEFIGGQVNYNSLSKLSDPKQVSNVK